VGKLHQLRKRIKDRYIKLLAPKINESGMSIHAEMQDVVKNPALDTGSPS
jgi:hypothetical protein